MRIPYGEVPDKLKRHLNDAAAAAYAAAVVADGDEVVESLAVRAQRGSDGPWLYVLTKRLLMVITYGGRDPEVAVWKLSQIASIAPKAFESESHFGSRQEVRFDALELRLDGRDDPLAIPGANMSTTYEDRVTFLGALWQAWVRA